MRPLLLLLLTASVAAGGQFTPTPTAVNDGIRATVDLPPSQQMKNVGGSDGAGLCVFTSLQHSARWQNLVDLEGYRQWMQRRPGGGYPQKVDATLKAFCREKGIAVPEYVQHTGGDDGFLDLALKTGRCPAVTYAGRDDFYRGTIAHMVNLAYMDSTHACIIDNNRPGTWLWMSRSDFLSRWRANDGGWAVVFLGPPPPPYTHLPATKLAFGCKCCKPKCTCEKGKKNPDCACYPCKCFEDEKTALVPLIDEKKEEPEPLTGVIPERIHDHPEYSITGVPATKAEAEGRLLQDDTDHWNLAVVGDGAFHAKVKADVDALPAKCKDKLFVQYLTPSSWQVAQFGLAPGVTLRKPAAGRVGGEIGTVSTADYSAAKLADLAAAPGGPRPQPPKPVTPPTPAPAPTPAPSPTTPTTPWGILGLILVTLLSYFFRKGK